MPDHDHLLQKARQQFAELAAYLDSEVKKLYYEGVLDSMDVSKLLEDSKASAQAVVDAIDRKDYPTRMQHELVERYISLYKSEIQRILDGARERLYTPDRIAARLKIIEEPVVRRLDELVQQRLMTDRQMDEINKMLHKSHDEVVRGITSIPHNHPRRHWLIDSWIEDYSKQIADLLQRYVPKLNCQTIIDSTAETLKE